MKLELYDCVDNEVTGHMPALAVERVSLHHNHEFARVDVRGDFPPTMKVLVTLAGVFLIDPYGHHRPFRIEIAPTELGDRRKIMYADKTVLQQRTDSVGAIFVFEPSAIPQL